MGEYEDTRICNALTRQTGYDTYQCVACPKQWTVRQLADFLGRPEEIVAEHMKLQHPGAVDAVLSMSSASPRTYQEALRRSMDVVAAQLAGERPPYTFTWDPAPKPKKLTAIKSAEAGAAVTEAEAILTLSLPLTWHLKFGCQCPACMEVFLACYDGFEAVFEEEESQCPVDKSESE